jgi:hypothetical protein
MCAHDVSGQIRAGVYTRYMDYDCCYVIMYLFSPFIFDSILVEAVRVCASP